MFDEIISFPSLLAAYQRARRGNRFKHYSCAFDFNMEDELFRLHQELRWQSYQPKPYSYFIITYPKQRHIAAPHFRDRVVQQAVVGVIEPLFEKSFINDTYACRKEKGVLYAMKRLQKFLRASKAVYPDQPLYVLQSDIYHFFQTVSWDVLLELICHKITCPRTFRLLKTIVTTHRTIGKYGRPIPIPEVVVTPLARRGLPIGNLTSQLFANVYLNELDHFIKDTLAEQWYGRYMDDFYIIHPDKDHLAQVRNQINEFLNTKLSLTLHPRKQTVLRCSDGVPFVGYRVFHDHVMVRANTLQRFLKRFAQARRKARRGELSEEELDKVSHSLDSHLIHADSYRLRQELEKWRRCNCTPLQDSV